MWPISSMLGRTTQEILEHPYQPQILDVIVVKAMLIKGLHLPPELVDNIVDQAEYWPHISSEVKYTTDGEHGFHTIGHSITANGTENEFLLRTVPLGFREWPKRPRTEQYGNIYCASVPPSAPGEEFPAGVFQALMDYPDPLITHPCRKIVFTIRSRDQGWGGDTQDHGTYHGSWTWFEAGVERWTEKNGNGSPEAQQQPSLVLEDLSTVYPTVAGSEDHTEFDHPLHPQEQLKIQCNKTAAQETLEHRVVWSYTDDADRENETAAAELAVSGRGTATGNGKFVRELKLGDIVTVWGKTRFQGWTNHVASVKMDLYWVV